MQSLATRQYVCVRIRACMRYLRNIVDESIELIGPAVLERGGHHVFPVLPQAGLCIQINKRKSTKQSVSDTT
jgi:hypothetical protein